MDGSAFNRMVVGALALACVSCDLGTEPDPDAPIDELPRSLSADEQTLIDQSNGFGLRLLREVVAVEERPNVILSPLSASMALGMTLNGAADATFAAMRATLGFEGLEQSQINDAYRSLIELLTDLDPNVTFEIANAIWASERYTFYQSFFDAVTAAFDARVETADFGDPATVDAVNGWVDEKTSGKIPEIVERLNSGLVMLLLNAMYFDGAWATRFDPDDTRPGSFTRPDGSQVTVDMMELSTGEFGLGGGHGYTAAELPYGGGAFAMVVVVPWDGDARTLATSMDDSRWAEVIGSLTPTEIDFIGLPKLKLTYDTFLNQPLSDMGMDIAFGPGADFSRMSPQGGGFCIAYVRQKTFLEVDEAGTRAAAVTAVSLQDSFSGLVANRPFLFAIRERLSGTILFAGLVEDPTADAVEPEEVATGC